MLSGRDPKSRRDAWSLRGRLTIRVRVLSASRFPGNRDGIAPESRVDGHARRLHSTRIKELVRLPGDRGVVDRPSTLLAHSTHDRRAEDQAAETGDHDREDEDTHEIEIDPSDRLLNSDPPHSPGWKEVRAVAIRRTGRTPDRTTLSHP